VEIPVSRWLYQRFRLDMAWSMATAWVVDNETGKRSQAYDSEEASQLCDWLNDRAMGYTLTHAKISAIILL
jgi:hypothetical protein